MDALSISDVADTEHALSVQLNTPERIYQANLDMKKFHQEVIRVSYWWMRRIAASRRSTFREERSIRCG